MPSKIFIFVFIVVSITSQVCGFYQNIYRNHRYQNPPQTVQFFNSQIFYASDYIPQKQQFKQGLPVNQANNSRVSITDGEFNLKMFCQVQFQLSENIKDAAYHQNSYQTVYIMASLSTLVIMFGLLALVYRLMSAKIARLEQERVNLKEQKRVLDQSLGRQIQKNIAYSQNKHYQVYWDKIIVAVANKICYNYVIYQGKFLNEEVHVFAVKLEDIDYSTIQKKLNKLLSCSHNRLAKLYFFTKEKEYLLAFTEKIDPLSTKQLMNHFNTKSSLQEKKEGIIELVETLDFLEEKIQLKWLPLQSIELIFSEKKQKNTYQFKINAIPCLFRIMSNNCKAQQNDTCSEDTPCFVRYNIAALFHLILLNGRQINNFQSKSRSKEFWEEKQFIEFILYEAKAIGHTHELLFQQILEHPFLWNNQRKMLFISDFSNYIETHLDESKIEKLEKYSKQYDIVSIPWNRHFHPSFHSQINGFRKYDYDSFRDLIRMIRNKINHFHEIPKEAKHYVGKDPQMFVNYCLKMFPKMLYFAYNYTRKKKMKLLIK